MSNIRSMLAWGRASAVAVAALSIGWVPAVDAQLIINEIMNNPAAVADSAGEWFEIHNPTAGPVDINGWTIEDNDIDSHVINNGGPLLVPAGGFMVLGNNDDPSTNGGVAVDYSYGSDWFLSNGADEVVLIDQLMTEVDRVEYDGGPAFPDPNGASMALVDPALDNNVGANWCTASTPFGDGDLGTPGGVNDCAAIAPELVINEIMNNPAAVADADGEWFEIFNPTAGAVDIDGWTIEDNDFDSHLISNGGPLMVPAGGYLVLGNNNDVLTNGGAPVDYSYGTDIALANGADEVVLLDTTMTEVDRVEYDGGPGFPDPTGASMALRDPALDNNVGASWCTASTPFGDGDLGTPGGANDCPVVVASIVVNEIHADPAGDISGDANGDGVRDATEDEFVEIINTNGGPLDISGWTLADGFGVRHVFPAGTILEDQCGVVVFGGGTPTGTFGNVVVQTASTGSLGLNNSGDTVIVHDGVNEVANVSYGSEGGDNQSLTLDPDVVGTLPWVKHTLATGSGGALFSPGTKIDGSFFDGCPAPPSGWIINEIHADPAPDLTGDANGDGVRDGSEDEFVEIVNATGGAVDISDWLLSDAVGTRHVFPAGTVVPDQCGVVVFGGGTPTGLFGSMTVQTASTGFLGLNNSGDTVTLNDGVTDVASVTYGSEGGDNQALTRDPDLSGPFVKHTLATGSGGALFSPGTLVDGSQFGGCPIIIPTLEIFEIQGNGASSPVENLTVTTPSNVVTALGTNGFFMQTPTERSDGDVDTSDGIFVFEGGAPSVAVGDLVDVTGQVVEFFGFTEFALGSAVTVVGTGAQPAPVVFDATVPSPDPTAPSCAIEYECYESMRVDVAMGAVTGPNQRFSSDPIAEVHITTAPERTFREPGIEFPGLLGFPLWDGNPEVFELDPDKLGLPNAIIPGGSTFSARGVLGFEFGDYELWPFELSVDENTLPIPVRPREFDEFTVGSLNMFRFFDDVDDPPDIRSDGAVRDDQVVSTAEYMRRRDKFVMHILNVLDAPDILAVQEVEKLGVLEDLAADITAMDPTVNYTSYLIEGNDIGTIDIGFMVRDSITVDDVMQLGKDETYENPVTMMEELLHDRPPLLLVGRHLDQTLVQVLGVHMRSLGGIDDPVDGPRVRQKRYEQANSVAEKVQLLQDLDPLAPIVVTGDFNGFEFTDGYVDLVGQIAGDFVPVDNLVCDTNPCPDLVDPDLENQLFEMPADERYSFIFQGNAQTLDHALTSDGMNPFLRGIDYGRGNADAAVDLINDDSTSLRSSDHDGLVLFVLADGDLDGVPDAQDVCPGTVIPEGVPTVRLGVNRWALVDEDFIFDTTQPGGRRMSPLDDFVGGGAPNVAPFTTTDTAGCSCEQIIDALGVGQGHVKFGCSTGLMRVWVKLVTP